MIQTRTGRQLLEVSKSPLWDLNLGNRPDLEYFVLPVFNFHTGRTKMTPGIDELNGVVESICGGSSSYANLISRVLTRVT